MPHQKRLLTGQHGLPREGEGHAQGMVKLAVEWFYAWEYSKIVLGFLQKAEEWEAGSPGLLCMQGRERELADH